MHRYVLESGEEPMPEGYVFDKTTQTYKQAKKQAIRISRSVSHAIEEYDIELSEFEKDMGTYQRPQWPTNVFLTGRADLTGYHQGMRVILDLKTSEDYHPAWLQLGAYALLDGHDPSNVPVLPAVSLGVIHAPRSNTGLGKMPDIIWAERPHEIITRTITQLDRIVELLNDPDKVTVSPGKQCKWCAHPNCPVRSVQFHPHV